MKISAKQYAKALQELTRGKDEKDIDSAVLSFAKELKKQRKLKLVGDIVNKFSDIYNKENGIAEADVISAREIDGEQMEKIKSFVGNKYEVKEVIINKKIDESIKGGIIIRVNDEVLDGSVSKKIKNLNNLLKK